MKFPTKFVAFSGAAALLMILLVISVECVLEANNSNGEQLASRSDSKRAGFNVVRNLFDIELYKKLYDKSYSSLTEQMLRVKYYTTRAIRVVVSAVKYANRKLNYHLAINHLSDRTESELDKMRNRLLDERTLVKARKSTLALNQERDTTSDEIQLDAVDLGERPYETLIELLEARKADRFYAELLGELRVMQLTDEQAKDGKAMAEELIKLTRSKREANPVDGISDCGEPFRKLPLNKLFNLGSNESLSPAAADKIPSEPEGNNLNYTGNELLFEMDTRGMRDQQVPVELKRMASKSKQPREALPRADSPVHRQQAAHFLDGLKRKYDVKIACPQTTISLPDELFVDLRDSDCFFLPRNQEQCGSCYAFAAISLIEYLYCKKTKKLVGFSEQYVVDCGREHYGDSIRGCSGGYVEDMAQFFHNFGLELRSTYPYQNQDNVCPYHEEHDLEGAGFIRTDIKRAWEVPLDSFEEVLKFSPILINIVTPDDFEEYGSGVHPNGCNNEGEEQRQHSMLLIGHGREDNEEYWLIRNSYSVGWGEGGYYKMLKKSRCIDHDRGWIFGSSDAKSLDMVIKPNHKYDEDLILEHYLAGLS